MARWREVVQELLRVDFGEGTHTDARVVSLLAAAITSAEASAAGDPEAVEAEQELQQALALYVGGKHPEAYASVARLNAGAAAKSDQEPDAGAATVTAAAAAAAASTAVAAAAGAEAAATQTGETSVHETAATTSTAGEQPGSRGGSGGGGAEEDDLNQLEAEALLLLGTAAARAHGHGPPMPQQQHQQQQHPHHHARRSVGGSSVGGNGSGSGSAPPPSAGPAPRMWCVAAQRFLQGPPLSHAAGTAFLCEVIELAQDDPAAVEVGVPAFFQNLLNASLSATNLAAAIRSTLRSAVRPIWARCGKCGALRLVREQLAQAAFACGSRGALLHDRHCYQPDDQEEEWSVEGDTIISRWTVDYGWFKSAAAARMARDTLAAASSQPPEPSGLQPQQGSIKQQREEALQKQQQQQQQQHEAQRGDQQSQQHVLHQQLLQPQQLQQLLRQVHTKREGPQPQGEVQRQPHSGRTATPQPQIPEPPADNYGGPAAPRGTGRKRGRVAHEASGSGVVRRPSGDHGESDESWVVDSSEAEGSSSGSDGSGEKGGGLSSRRKKRQQKRRSQLEAPRPQARPRSQPHVPPQQIQSSPRLPAVQEQQQAGLGVPLSAVVGGNEAMQQALRLLLHQDTKGALGQSGAALRDIVIGRLQQQQQELQARRRRMEQRQQLLQVLQQHQLQPQQPLQPQQQPQTQQPQQQVQQQQPQSPGVLGALQLLTQQLASGGQPLSAGQMAMIKRMIATPAEQQQQQQQAVPAAASVKGEFSGGKTGEGPEARMRELLAKALQRVEATSQSHSPRGPQQQQPQPPPFFAAEAVAARGSGSLASLPLALATAGLQSAGNTPRAAAASAALGGLARTPPAPGAGVLDSIFEVLLTSVGPEGATAVVHHLREVLHKWGVESEEDMALFHSGLSRALSQLVKPGMDRTASHRAVSMALDAALMAFERTKERLQREQEEQYGGGAQVGMSAGAPGASVGAAHGGGVALGMGAAGLPPLSSAAAAAVSLPMLQQQLLGGRTLASMLSDARLRSMLKPGAAAPLGAGSPATSMPPAAAAAAAAAAVPLLRQMISARDLQGVGFPPGSLSPSLPSQADTSACIDPNPTSTHAGRPPTPEEEGVGADQEPGAAAMAAQQQHLTGIDPATLASGSGIPGIPGIPGSLLPAPGMQLDALKAAISHVPGGAPQLMQALARALAARASTTAGPAGLTFLGPHAMAGAAAVSGSPRQGPASGAAGEPEGDQVSQQAETGAPDP